MDIGRRITVIHDRVGSSWNALRLDQSVPGARRIPVDDLTDPVVVAALGDQGVLVVEGLRLGRHALVGRWLGLKVVCLADVAEFEHAADWRSAEWAAVHAAHVTIVAGAGPLPH